MIMRALVGLAVVAGLAACHDQDRRGEGTVTAKGMVVHVDLEGSFYGIVTDAGQKYLPENLDPAFQKDSLRVSFEGTVTDRPTAMMWGRTLTIRHIEALP